jgi:hypothetical protein
LLTREGGGNGDGRGAESFDRKKVWSSINHSALFGYIHGTKKIVKSVRKITLFAVVVIGTIMRP